MINLLLSKSNIVNSISSAIESIIAPLIMLVMVPIFLNLLGPNSFAIWVLVNSFVASLMALSFGGGNTLIKYISDKKYKDTSILSSIFVFQIFILIILSFFFWVFSFIAENFFDYSLHIYTGFIISIFFIKQLESLNYSFCKGKERYDISSLLSAIAKILFLSTQLVILIYTNDLKLIFKYAIYVSFLFYLIQIVILKKLFADFMLLKAFNIKNIKIFFNYSIWNWFISIVGMLFTNFDKWLVGFVMGLEVLGYYAIAVLFFNQTYMIINSLVAWFFPMVSSKGITKEIIYLYNILIKVIAIITTICSIFLLNFNQLFIFWLGFDTYKLTADFIYLFICLLPIFSLRITPHFMLLAMGYVQKKFLYDLGALLIRAIIGVYILHFYGINFFIAAFLIDMIATNIMYNLSFFKYLDRISMVIFFLALLFSIFSLITFL